MDNGTWIFIVEGLATITPGGISFHALQDYPETARFLSKPECDLAANCWEKLPEHHIRRVLPLSRE